MLIKEAKDLIGNTPMFCLMENNNEIYIKLEKYNLAGSIKDRAVLSMLEDMEETHQLQPNDVLIEATSGNTGIALAALGLVKGYHVIIIMPETMSIERQQLIKAYKAELILSDGSLGMNGAMDKMQALMKDNPHYKSIQQFSNKANNKAHYQYTAKEILADLKTFNYFIAGIGTGGTISGCGKAFKEYDDKIKVIGVEPAGSPLISQNKSGPHKIQGIGANFVPDNYEAEYVDEVVSISDDEAIQAARRFLKDTGILIGISSGASLAYAYKLASKHSALKIVCISSDGGEKYLMGGIYD